MTKLSSLFEELLSRLPEGSTGVILSLYPPRETMLPDYSGKELLRELLIFEQLEKQEERLKDEDKCSICGRYAGLDYDYKDGVITCFSCITS